MSQEFQDWEPVIFKNTPSSTKKNQKKTIENRVQDSIKSQNATNFKLENEQKTFAIQLFLLHYPKKFNRKEWNKN